MLDILLTFLLVYYLYQGYKRGFIVELVSTICFFIVFLILSHYFQEIKTSLIGLDFFTNESTSDILLYILCFIGLSLLIKGFAWVFTKVLNIVGLGWLNKLLGAFVSVSRFIFILGSLCYLFSKFYDEDQISVFQYFNKSKIFMYLNAKIFPIIHNLWNLVVLYVLKK